MKKLIAALTFAVPTIAAAQDDNAPVNVQVNIGIPMPGAPAAPPAQRAAKPPPARTIGGDAFEVAYEPWKGQQSFSVLSPEGAECDVWNDEGELEGHYSVPFNFAPRSGSFYRLIVTQNGAVVLDKKVEAREYLQTVVRARGAPAARAAAPAAAPACDFPGLVSAVKGETFSDAKLNVISTADCRFSVEQVGQLVDSVDMSSDKVRVVELLRARLTDPGNAFKLYAHFTFEGDKKKVKALLGK